MIVYIAGKMTGLPDFGKVAFSRAESMLTGLGYTVINPAWLGDDLPKKCYMPICLTMLAQADTLVLLEGWEKSPGARLEKEFAEYQEMPVYHINYLLRKGKEGLPIESEGLSATATEAGQAD